MEMHVKEFIYPQIYSSLIYSLLKLMRIFFFNYL